MPRGSKKWRNRRYGKDLKSGGMEGIKKKKREEEQREVKKKLTKGEDDLENDRGGIIRYRK